MKVFLAILALGTAMIVANMFATGDWSVLTRLGIHQSVPAQIVVPSQTPMAVPSLSQTAANPTDVVDPGTPELITFRRGDQQLFSCDVRLYTPEGDVIDPKGEGANDAFLIDPKYVVDLTVDPNHPRYAFYSFVGSKQGTAFIIGHRSEWQDKFCFNRLVEVQQGDLIDVTVPSGIVTFVVPEAPVSHPKGTWFPLPDQTNVLEVVTCQDDSTNFEIRAEYTSSKRIV